MADKAYIIIDMKSFYASCECVARGLPAMTTDLVVADPERGKGTICLAVSPSLKAKGIKNRCRVHEPSQPLMMNLQPYINAISHLQKSKCHPY